MTARTAPRSAEPLSTFSCDVLVVGGGPAGMAAAAAAAAVGRRVILLDDNRGPGGQIWRAGIAEPASTAGAAQRRALGKLRRSGVEALYGRRVVDAPESGWLHALNEDAGTLECFRWQQLVLATGGRERLLPFPGWTLPGVFGVGGLQALAKGGFPVTGKRVVIAGTGPLLIAVAAHLREDGAEVLMVAEQAPMRQLAPFALHLLRQPGKLIQGVRHRAALRRTRYRTGCWPVRAEGEGKLAAVHLTDGRRTWVVPCDLLACGFHLVPNTELPRLLGCALRGGFVEVDSLQRTAVSGVFCAGEPTGIAGVDAALLAGRIAGLAAAGRTREAAKLRRRRDREKQFGAALDRAFALRPELRSLAQADTILCRCEDVAFGEVQRQSSWTAAKLQTRCGMGSCQGRVCGSAAEFLFGWQHSSVRPPLFPIPLSAFLAGEVAESDRLPSPAPTLLQEIP